jgi:hypothetical protein
MDQWLNIMNTSSSTFRLGVEYIHYMLLDIVVNHYICVLQSAVCPNHPQPSVPAVTDSALRQWFNSDDGA